MTEAASPQNGRLNRICDRVFLLGLLASVVFVLWLPLFPTGDGPVHLYYANVLWSLLRHQPTYAHDYAIRHLFAPYLVHYLALVAFEHILSPTMAEKLFVALIFVTQAFGFRFMARRLGGNASVACLWMLPLLFSWSLAGGFLNCCFSTGIMFWAFGVWTLLGTDCRQFFDPTPGGRAPGARLGLLLAAHAALLALLVLSHPVPLLVLLLFTASDLLLRLFTRRATGLTWRSLAPQVIAFAMTCCAFVAPVLLAQKGQAGAAVSNIAFHSDVMQELFAGNCLSMFVNIDIRTAGGWIALVPRLGLLFIVPGVPLLLTRSPGRPADGSTEKPSRSQRLLALLPQQPATRLLLIALIYLAATVFFPRSLNNSYFFPQRMWDIVWPLILACGAAAPFSLRAARNLAGVALGLIAITAWIGAPLLTSIARAQQQLAQARLPAGGRGLFLEPDSAEDPSTAGLTYPVYDWSGARAFAAGHAILLNSPWLELTISPLRDSSGPPGPAPLLDRDLPSFYSESALMLTRTLASPAAEDIEFREHQRFRDLFADRAAILARADFLLYSNPAAIGQPDEAAQTRRTALALLGAQGAAWHCVAHGFYAVCVRNK